MRKFKFWSSTEDNALRTCISKFKNDVKAAKWASKKLDRTVASVYQRINLIKSGKEIKYKILNEVPKPIVDVVVNEEKGLNIPKGFTFDIVPSKAVMFVDHVRLYF